LIGSKGMVDTIEWSMPLEAISVLVAEFRLGIKNVPASFFSSKLFLRLGEGFTLLRKGSRSKGIGFYNYMRQAIFN